MSDSSVVLRKHRAKSRVVVIDHGTGFCKAGFAGDSQPMVEFPSVVGRPRYIPVVAGLHYHSEYIGSEAQSMRGVLSLSYPIRSGIVEDWEDMRTLWEHTFENLLEIDPHDCAVIVTEAPRNPHYNREKMIELLFDMGCTGAFVAIQGVLALYTGGRTTGLVLDSGDGVSHAVPVYEGYAIQHAILRMQYAGRTLTDYLGQLLTERGYYFTSTAETEILRDIKEKLCFVSKDFWADRKKSAQDPERFETSYKLPDGQVITIGSERFRCPEMLFNPAYHLNLEEPGFQRGLYASVLKCDVDLRSDILENVMMSGGNTLFHGLPERLCWELQDLCPSPVRVFSPPERRYSVWLGGSILGALSTFSDICITRREFDEYGPGIVHRKCF